MKLALEFGMTERELLTRMDAREYGKWKAFFRIFPFNQERADLRAAMIAANNANSMRDRSQRPYKISDFLFDFIKEVKRQTPEQMKCIVKMFAMAHNSSSKGRL